MQPRRPDRGIRVTLTGMVVNTFLAGGKIAAGVAGHSHALVADGIESLADILSSLVVWRGLVVAATPADEDHPYGHGKAEPIAAAVVATMLLFAAAGIVFSATMAMAHPHSAPSAFTLPVLLGVVAVKEFLYRLARREARLTDSPAVHSDAWHHRSDALTSFAAALGITVALVGGADYAMADDAAAVVAGCVIAWNAWRLLRSAANELMDASPGGDLEECVRRTASQIHGVRRIEKCRLRKMGVTFYVDLHVEVNPDMSVREAHAIAHHVKDRVRESLPAISDVLVHVEPAAAPPPA